MGFMVGIDTIHRLQEGLFGRWRLTSGLLGKLELAHLENVDKSTLISRISTRFNFIDPEFIEWLVTVWYRERYPSKLTWETLRGEKVPDSIGSYSDLGPHFALAVRQGLIRRVRGGILITTYARSWGVQNKMHHPRYGTTEWVLHRIPLRAPDLLRFMTGLAEATYQEMPEAKWHVDTFKDRDWWDAELYPQLVSRGWFEASKEDGTIRLSTKFIVYLDEANDAPQHPFLKRVS